MSLTSTKYCIFFIVWWRKSCHYQILEWCFGRTLLVRMRTEENKPLQQGQKQQNLIIPPSAEIKCENNRNVTFN